MKIVSGSEALIAIALGLPVYIRSKSKFLPVEDEWKKTSVEASLRLFLEDHNIFEYGVPVQDK